jgi:hypothetical protein
VTFAFATCNFPNARKTEITKKFVSSMYALTEIVFPNGIHKYFDIMSNKIINISSSEACHIEGRLFKFKLVDDLLKV